MPINFSVYLATIAIRHRAYQLISHSQPSSSTKHRWFALGSSGTPPVSTTQRSNKLRLCRAALIRNIAYWACCVTVFEFPQKSFSTPRQLPITADAQMMRTKPGRWRTITCSPGRKFEGDNKNKEMHRNPLSRSLTNTHTYTQLSGKR